ncbi:dihydrodipicolinate synthase/N-acetylneuraminate lyase [Nitrobacteraceae bacterium AZCC 2161]
MRLTRVERNQPGGFRIGSNGEVEAMTEAEAEAVVKRVVREAMYSAGWPWFVRTLH